MYGDMGVNTGPTQIQTQHKTVDVIMFVTCCIWCEHSQISLFLTKIFLIVYLILLICISVACVKTARFACYCCSVYLTNKLLSRTDHIIIQIF